MRFFCGSRTEAEEKRLQWLVVQRSDVRVDFVMRTFKSLGVERITDKPSLRPTQLVMFITRFVRLKS